MDLNSFQSLIVLPRISLNALKRVNFSLKRRFNESSMGNKPFFLKSLSEWVLTAACQMHEGPALGSLSVAMKKLNTDEVTRYLSVAMSKLTTSQLTQ